MKILAKPSEFLLVVKDDSDRDIYTNKCVNLVHYECIKLLLLKLKDKQPIDNNLLKPLNES